MKKLIGIAIVVLAHALSAQPALAAEGEALLDQAPIDPRDVTSLQAGARNFVNYCLNCHSASLMRYSKLEELGLTEAQIKDNLLFTADKVGGEMSVAMTQKEGKDWFGTSPPDLSVIARSRSADWLYTYLRGFYRDPATATGWNNVVFPNVAMPNVLWQLQGVHVLKPAPAKQGEHAEGGGENGQPKSTASLQSAAPGTMTPVEYDIFVRDLVNYLVWMSEPSALTRVRTGIVVLLFLSILVVLTFVLYKEFWKDVH